MENTFKVSYVHPSNLQVIKWEDNLSKSSKCNITINELIYSINLDRSVGYSRFMDRPRKLVR